MAAKTPAKKPTVKATKPKRNAAPPAKKRVKPVVVTQYTRRSGNDVLPGSWVDVVSGEHQGRRGAYLSDETNDPQTGYPERIVVRTRDAQNDLIVVNYEDVRPSDYTGGR